MGMRDVLVRFGRDLRGGNDIAGISFVVMAQSELIDEVTITEHPDLFVVWDANWTGKVGTIVSDEGKLYRKINSDFATPFPQSKPSADKSQWKEIGNPADEWPPWAQPLGAHDAYSKLDKVSYSGKHWISDVNGNVWQPGVYGWTEVA